MDCRGGPMTDCSLGSFGKTRLIWYSIVVFVNRKCNFNIYAEYALVTHKSQQVSQWLFVTTQLIKISNGFK